MMVYEFAKYPDETLVVFSDIRKKDNGEEYIKNLNVDIFLFGHLHKQLAFKIDKTLVLNPGSLNRPRDNSKGSYLILKPVFQNKKGNQNAVYDNFLKDIKGGVSNDFMSQREQPNIDIREKL